ncbi:unnamed protein product [Camellia sinensis]
MADAAEIISGKWLKFWIEVGAVLSTIGLFEAQLSSSAYQVLGMAELAFLPKVFGLRSKWFNTPWVGILLSTVITLAVSHMTFTDIISSANFLYSLGMLLEFASFVWLRRKFPAMKRPYRVPMKLPGLIIMCLIPSGFLVFIMAIATKIVYLVSGLMTVAGIGWYFLMKNCKQRRWIEFNNGEQRVYRRSFHAAASSSSADLHRSTAPRSRGFIAEMNSAPLMLHRLQMGEVVSTIPSWYVDVILQLIDKAGDFVSDDIWFRVVQFVTNNEDLQLYVAVKAREYLDKPTVHETMAKVSAYILGEYSHLLARRPGCSPKEIFSIIHEKLPTVLEGHLNFCFLELQNQIWAIFHKYESCIDVEIQQRVVEYFALCRKGADLVDILTEMPKFPEHQSALIRKAEDTEADTAEQSATKLQSLHQTSNALVVTDQRSANGMPPVNQLGLVKVPNMSNVVDYLDKDHNSADQGMTEANGTLTVVDPQPLDPFS